MKRLFDELSYSVSKRATRKYSTSFSLGIRALRADIQSPIYAIYGFVRLADEIVDSFHGYNKSSLLQRLRADVFNALEEEISLNPIINSFQKTVNEYKIDPGLIDVFLKSMEMDLHRQEYNTDKYKEYILGSAESVGLMCLQIFVNGDKQKYNQLKPYAMKLGSAFQKVNFLRDLKNDYQILGRTYFPNVDFRNFGKLEKRGIETEIEEEFLEALHGIKMLPASSKFGVFLAYTYFLALFNKMKSLPPEAIINERIRINNRQKLSLMISSYFQIKLARI